MKIGAQLYSVRDLTKTPDSLYLTMKKMKEIGYDVAHASAICNIEAERLRDFSLEIGLPITVTHSAFDRIVNDTDALIKEHKIYMCPTIGIGGMPLEFRGSQDGVRAFLSKIETPIKKIKDAGLSFAYHNHHFEFEDIGGVRAYDMLAECEDLCFILDTYWMKYAGVDYMNYIRTFGRKRITDVHLKDMKSEPQGNICAVGDGIIDFKPVINLCDEVGIKYGHVEQDNAPEFGSASEMEKSYRAISKIVR